jgi:hypothetical protein
VADDQHRRPVAFEEILEPERRLEVEMVGRLVEQQQVRAGEEQGGQRDPHPPAAREAVERLRLLASSKPRPTRMRAARAGAAWAPIAFSRSWMSPSRWASCVSSASWSRLVAPRRPRAPSRTESPNRRESPARYSRSSRSAYLGISAAPHQRRRRRSSRPPRRRPASGSTCRRPARSARSAPGGRYGRVAPSRIEGTARRGGR